MKRLLLFIGFIGFAISVSAQLGVNVKYNSNDSPEWNRIVSTNVTGDVKLHESGYEFGLDMWGGLTHYRVEFTPEFSYAKNTSEFTSLTQGLNSYERQAISFTFNTNIYLLNISRAAECPTNQFIHYLRKNFFIRLSPGATYFINEVNAYDQLVESKTAAFKFGAGVGFDFRLGDVAFITPYFMYNYYPAATFEGLKEVHPGTDDNSFTNDSSINQKQVGIRIGIVPNFLRRSRKFYR